MADDTIYGGWGATAYTPLNEWKYVPFYKKNVFTGAGQFDQAANLITSPSFQNFWSSGGSQSDFTTGIRIESEMRDVGLASDIKRRNIDISSKLPPRPRLPTPPPHIRPIELDPFGMPKIQQGPIGDVGEALGLGGQTAREAFETGMFVPSKYKDIWPHMTAEEQSWWNQRLRGVGEGNNYNQKMLNWQHANSASRSVPIELRGIAGALPREERMLYNTLHYGMDAGVAKFISPEHYSRFDLKNYRLVNASDPSNLLGVSQELSDSRKFLHPNNRIRTGISLLTSDNPELPLNLREARRVIKDAGQLSLENNLVRADQMWTKTHDMADNFNSLKNAKGNLGLYSLEDVPPVVKDEFAVGVGQYNQNKRNIGGIKRDMAIGVGADGKPWTDPLPTTTTTVYGPPSKSAQWMARGEQALHVGGKALMVLGGVMEQFNVPDRMKGYYINALQQDPNWRPDPSDKLGMAMWAGVESALNFGTMGMWDQKERIATDMTSGAGRGKGFYGTMVPPVGTTSVHSVPDRYERQGISFNHVYPQAPR